eukprot:13855171-Alexandrium_andersonii.AAC.1
MRLRRTLRGSLRVKRTRPREPPPVGPGRTRREKARGLPALPPLSRPLRRARLAPPTVSSVGGRGARSPPP